jgi:hypothetical protein
MAGCLQWPVLKKLQCPRIEGASYRGLKRGNGATKWGNEGGVMRPLFSFRWRSSGSTVGWREAGRRRQLVCLALVREEEEDDRLGREGELGRPRG